MADEKEKNGKVMVSRTPGGGRGVGRSQQPDHSRTTPIAPITSTCTCLQTAPAREYSRRNPAAEPPTHGAQDPVRGVPPQPSPTCACKTKQGKARMSSAKAKAGRVRDAARAGGHVRRQNTCRGAAETPWAHKPRPVGCHRCCRPSANIRWWDWYAFLINDLINVDCHLYCLMRLKHCLMHGRFR